MAESTALSTKYAIAGRLGSKLLTLCIINLCPTRSITISFKITTLTDQYVDADLESVLPLQRTIE
jgi:hypothetical protein